MPIIICSSCRHIVRDTIHDLLEEEKWDYKNIYSTVADKIPQCKPLPDEIPFHQARELSVKIHVAPKGKTDVYVDDIITTAADIKDNLERITKASVTIMHAVADNAKTDGHIKRNDIVTLDKMLAEEAPVEDKFCLGWILNTRSSQVKLPSHKAVAWTSQIDSILNGKSVSSNTLE